MKIEDIVKKIVAGEELTAAEKTFLGGYDFGDAGRIPKARLDQEIEKRKAAEAKASELETKLSEVTTKVEELENNGLSEAEKARKESEKAVSALKSQLAALAKEREDAVTTLKTMERKARVKELASKFNFSDSEYLDYLAASKQVELTDDAAVTSFVKELEKSSPGLFKSTARPGGGTTGGGTTGSVSSAEQRIREILSKPELSTREASEVIKLQGELKKNAVDTQKLEA